jgi:MarR family transcriptional regulator, negative regulator of the multidrug operon emrRAB
MTADERTGNLLGALALTLADHIGTGSDAAALITLRNYAEGEPLDLLRRALALSHPGVVRLADRLESRGLVQRRRSERDRRAVALRLTRAGRRAADEAQKARAAAIDAALGAIGPDERRVLEGMLERMLAAQTTDATASLVICRLCDPDVCGHPEGCPVTQAAIAVGA